jgi:hypothetical protein
MRLNEFFSPHSLVESEETDIADRSAAAEIHAGVVRWLEDRKQYLEDVLMTSPVNGGSYTLNLGRIDTDYRNVFLLFGPKGAEHVRAGAGTSGDKIVIAIFCLRAPNDLQNLITRFATGYKRDFVHEFQHMLSIQRRGNVRGGAKHMDSGKIKDYFNNNDETNAYYQEGAQEALEMFQVMMKHAPEHCLRLYGDLSVAELVKHCRRYFNRDFLEFLNEKNRRAFDKRLARFVQHNIWPLLHPINEQWDRSVKTNHDAFDVHRNPSRNELLKLLKKWGGDECRISFCKNKDVLVFDSNIATHTDVEMEYRDEIDKEFPTALVCGNSRGFYIMLHHAYSFREDYINSIVPTFLQNPNLVKMLGHDFGLFAENDSGDTINLSLERYRHS